MEDSLYSVVLSHRCSFFTVIMFRRKDTIEEESYYWKWGCAGAATNEGRTHSSNFIGCNYLFHEIMQPAMPAMILSSVR
jgi:hypothetical protein